MCWVFSVPSAEVPDCAVSICASYKQTVGTLHGCIGPREGTSIDGRYHAGFVKDDKRNLNRIFSPLSTSNATKALER